MANNKLTYPALYGLNDSRTYAHQLIQNALKNLKPFKKKSLILKSLAEYIVSRDH